MAARRDLRPYLEHPEMLERFYAEDAAAFRLAFDDLWPDVMKMPVARAWRARLDASADVPVLRRLAPPENELAWLAVLSAVAFAAVRIPIQWPKVVADEYFVVNGSAIALGPLALYAAHAARTSLATRAFVTAALAGCILYANRWLRGTADGTVLAHIHLPIVLWALVGIGIVRRGDGRASGRIDFVRFTTEMVIVTGLLLAGGALLTGLTLALFGMVGIDPSGWYLTNVVPWGIVTAPLVGAYIDGRRTDASRLAPRLANPFLPLLLLTLVPYVWFVLARGAAVYEQREFLSAVDAVVVAVAYVVLAVLCEAGRGPRRPFIDVCAIVLVATTLVLDAVAVWAILARIRMLGWWPTRVAVLGTNLVILVSLAGVLWRQVGLVRGRVTLARVHGWIAGCLPVFAAWAAIVVFVLPLSATEGVFRSLADRRRVGSSADRPATPHPATSRYVRMPNTKEPHRFRAFQTSSDGHCRAQSSVTNE